MSMNTAATPKKNAVIGIVAAIAALALCLVTYLAVLPAHYLSLDVNPSVALETNRLNHVVTITPLNADAEALLQGYRPDDRDLDDVIEDIVDRMILMGYLTPENSDVLITVKDGKASAELLAQANAQIASYLEYRMLGTNVQSQLVAMDEELVKAAEALDISPGKMAIIDTLVKSDPQLTPEQLAASEIKDLVARMQPQDLALPQPYDDDRFDDIYDLDDYDDRYDDDNYIAPANADLIGHDQARALAQAKAPAAAITKCELDCDDGRYHYDIEMKADKTEYECEIDAVTGEIYQWDVDRDEDRDDIYDDLYDDDLYDDDDDRDDLYDYDDHDDLDDEDRYDDDWDD